MYNCNETANKVFNIRRLIEIIEEMGMGIGMGIGIGIGDLMLIACSMLMLEDRLRARRIW